MNLEVGGWTERMVIVTLADFTAESVEPAQKRTDELYLGYWLQRHGLSTLDKEEVVEACLHLEDKGLVQRSTNGNPEETDTIWSLTGEGLEEAKNLWSVFESAL